VRTNPLKKKLQEGKAAVGAWIIVDHPAMGEILADAGFDYVVLDGEHGQFTIESMRSVLQAIGRTDVVPLIRVADNNPVLIKQILDLGPEGIIIPMVNTAEQAREAVRACRYPPAGIRGVGVGRAQRYGHQFKEYFSSANDNLLICVQIEHEQAVKNVDEILAVEGIDCIYIGPADMSGSMGIPLQFDHPDLIAAIEKVMEAAKRAGVPSGMWCASLEHAAEMIKKGLQFVSFCSDVSLLVAAAKDNYQRCVRLAGL